MQLLIGRAARIQELLADMQAQLGAASERYQRMEAVLQHKHRAEVAQLRDEIKVTWEVAAAAVACHIHL